MKLLKPFIVGDIVRTNYDTGPYRIVEIHDGCTCANYVDSINNGDAARPREPHSHFVAVSPDEPITKSGTYPEYKQFYLGPFVYKNGECVDVDGPNAEGTTGWHDEDDGLDKLILVRPAARLCSPIKTNRPRRTSVPPGQKGVCQ